VRDLVLQLALAVHGAKLDPLQQLVGEFKGGLHSPSFP
jgi:hypothetical protein